MKYKFNTSSAVNRLGFGIWGVVCLIISIVGFWPSFIVPSLAGNFTSLSTTLPLHIIFTSIWLVLLISQPVLVQSNRIDLHRLFGMFGAIVAIGVVITGVIVQTDVMGSYAELGDLRKSVGLPFFRLVALLIYAICITVAIVLRGSRPDGHKRLMVLGTFALLQAPLTRMYENVFHFSEISGLLGVVSHTTLMVLFIIWDRRALGRFHRVTLWGTVLIAIVVFGVAPIASTDWWKNAATWLANH